MELDYQHPFQLNLWKKNYKWPIHNWFTSQASKERNHDTFIRDISLVLIFVQAFLAAGHLCPKLVLHILLIHSYRDRGGCGGVRGWWQCSQILNFHTHTHLLASMFSNQPVFTIPCIMLSTLLYSNPLSSRIKLENCWTFLC